MGGKLSLKSLTCGPYFVWKIENRPNVLCFRGSSLLWPLGTLPQTQLRLRACTLCSPWSSTPPSSSPLRQILESSPNVLLTIVVLMCNSVVEFASSSDMKNAIEKLNDTELNGRMITVTEDRGRDSSSRRRRRLHLPFVICLPRRSLLLSVRRTDTRFYYQCGP